MARPKDPRAAAARVRTELAASRLNDELETQLAMGDELDPEWERRAEQARDELAERFGGFDRLHELARDRPPGTSEARRPRRSSAGHGGRRRAGAPKPPAPAPPTTPAGRDARAGGAGAGGRAPASKKPAPRTTRPARGRGRGRGAGARAWQQTGIPGAGRGAAAFALQTLGILIGLALLYLVLSNAERARQGAGVLEQTLGVITGIVGRFVSPGDPLAPRAAARPPADETRRAGPGPSLPAGLGTSGMLGGLPKTYTNQPRAMTP